MMSKANVISKRVGFAVAFTAALLFFHFRLAAHAHQSPAFDGTTLAGWHAQGSANWSAAGGSIIGSVGNDTAAGWLVLDHPYEDVILRFSFECTDCETGVLFRGAKVGDGVRGIYLSLAGADRGSVYRTTIDSQGRTFDQTLVGVPTGQDGQPLQIEPRVNGWNQVWIFLRGNALGGEFNNNRIREFNLETAKAEEQTPYGQLAFRISGRPGAEARFKDISIEDLTERKSLPVEVTDRPFRERKLTDTFYSEGIAVGDLNRDGVQDVVAGPFYYLGPDYSVAREIYPSKPFNPNTPPYSDSFLNYVYDFNGDGWPDVLKINFQGAFLYLNPHGEDRHWDVYRVVNGISAETTQFVDVDGDGRPELVLSQGQSNTQICQIGYARPDWSDPTKPWAIHAISEVGNWGHHGMGVGDINGDGRMDIVQAKGWWEQPPTGTDGLWKFHPAPFGGGEWTEMNGSWAGGADMFVYDVNGDGLPDVITSLAAHGWGLVWFEQNRDERGDISWKRHVIMGNPSAPDRQEWEETDKSVAFSELHALALADIDGDGLKDVITGKRWWSHGDNYGTPEVQSAAVLYWFRLVRKTGGQVEWIPHRINNSSGVGTQIAAADMKGDGKVSILTSARKGAFIFLNDR
jgi:hypothetical protein